jgi:hypothetical protein
VLDTRKNTNGGMGNAQMRGGPAGHSRERWAKPAGQPWANPGSSGVPTRAQACLLYKILSLLLKRLLFRSHSDTVLSWLLSSYCLALGVTQKCKRFDVSVACLP